MAVGSSTPAPTGDAPATRSATDPRTSWGSSKPPAHSSGCAARGRRTRSTCHARQMSPAWTNSSDRSAEGRASPVVDRAHPDARQLVGHPTPVLGRVGHRVLEQVALVHPHQCGGQHFRVVPVSYTHLTLPTIYSV